jgi:chemotaxis protein MotB
MEGECGRRTAGYDDLDVPVGVRDGRLVITLPSSVAFGSGKAELSSAGKTVLDKLAQHLKKDYPSARFFIEGHTDTDPIQKSSFASNRELSMARAMAVLTYLVENCKISDEQFVVVGQGQYQPIASNASADGKAKNRRVEIIVHTEKN